MIDEPISKFMNCDVLHGPGDTPLQEVVRRMNDSLQSAFVVCEDLFPVGVITERDIVSVLDATFAGREFDGVRASEVMTAPIHTLSERATMGEVIRVMNEQRFRRVPIVDDEGLLSGIVNYMELQAATNSALERRGRDLEIAVMERTAELQAANRKLQDLSVRDGLTGLLNRRSLTEMLTELHAVARRYGTPYTVVLADIDHFKKYNDTAGHLMGDEAIKACADVMTRTVRESDSVFRFGGEEFLVAMPQTEAEGAKLVANRISQTLEALAIPHPASSAGSVVTLSLGYACVTQENVDAYDTWEEVVENADRALYAAKANGRNRIAGPHQIE